MPSTPAVHLDVSDAALGTFENPKDTMVQLAAEPLAESHNKYQSNDPIQICSKGHIEEPPSSTTHLVASKHKAFRGFKHAAGSSANSNGAMEAHFESSYD